eukprot:1429093-Alexandrium_andersonii.AAC.1
MSDAQFAKCAGRAVGPAVRWGRAPRSRPYAVHLRDKQADWWGRLLSCLTHFLAPVSYTHLRAHETSAHL